MQAEEAPEATVAGVQVSVEGSAGATSDRADVLLEPFNVAVTVAVASTETAAAVAVKVAVVAEAKTVTEAGTVAEALLEDRATAAPPVGAAEFRVTVQVEEPAPVKDEGEQARLLTSGGGAVMLRAEVLEVPLAVAVTVTAVVAATVPAVAVNPAEVAPEATVTEAGTVTATLLDAKVTA